jgi:hypothetical protein
VDLEQIQELCLHAEGNDARHDHPGRAIRYDKLLTLERKIITEMQEGFGEKY